MHGGSAPQVIAAARLRILAAVDPALNTLIKLLKTRSKPVVLGAAKDLLDRAGLRTPEEILARIEVNDPGRNVLPDSVIDELLRIAAAKRVELESRLVVDEPMRQLADRNRNLT